MLIAAVIAAGVIFLPRDSPDTLTANTVNAPDFQFSVIEGNGLDGYEYLRVTEHGDAEFCWPEYTLVNNIGSLRVRLIKFKVNDSHLASLRQGLIQVKFMTARHDLNYKGIDGAHVIAVVSGGGQSHAVKWANLENRKCQRLRTLCRQITEPVRTTMGNSASEISINEWNAKISTVTSARR